MSLFGFFFAIIFLHGIVEGKHISPLIRGGIPTEYGEFPFLVSIYFEGSFQCQGVLIAQDVVLTEGWWLPIDDPFTPEKWEVRVGDFNLTVEDPFEERITPSELELHPDTRNNDLALLFLSKNASISEMVSPIQLPDGRLIENHKGTLIAWGMDESGGYPSIPLKQLFKVAKQELCDNYFGGVIPKDNFCVSSHSEEEAPCIGDLGGPFIVNGTLQGIEIKNFGSCRPQGPELVSGLFLAIHRYVPWITEQIQQRRN